MQRYRPPSVLVIAILHLVGGGLGLLSDLCGLGSVFMADAGQGALSAPAAQRPRQPSTFSAADLMRDLEKNAPAYRAYMIGAMVLSFLLDVMLVAGGIGLLDDHFTSSPPVSGQTYRDLP
jgi:hypothetical protein